MEKKGQAGLNTFLTGLVIVSAVLILIVLLIFIFGILMTSFESTALANTVTNESGAYINSTGYQLADSLSGGPRGFSITTAINGSGGEIITATNYTIGTTGTVTNATATSNWGNVNITYDYLSDSPEIAASRTSQTNTSRAVQLVGILFVVILIGAVITVIITSMLRKGKA